MVAIAAPRMPMSSPKISSGSSTQFSTAPLVRPIMANTALPWNRSWLFSTSDAHIYGAPSRIYAR